MLEAGIAIAQPDPAHAGGITEVFRIATLAESYDVQLAPHCPLGPVALAACVQLDLAVPNFYAQEHVIDLSLAGLGRPARSCATPRCWCRWPATSSGRPARAWASRSTRTPCAPPHRPDLLVPEGNPSWTYPDGGFAEW